jgi:DNA-binding NtrC family response regulator
MAKKPLNQKDIKKYSVLIVEDDQLTQMGLEMICKDLFNSVSVTGKVNEAENLLKNNNYDVVFIDLHLNGKQVGTELVKLAKINNAYTIVLSASKSELHIKESYINGCNDFLSKPFNKASLKIIYNKFINQKEKNILNNIFKKDYITSDTELISNIKKIISKNIYQSPTFITGPTGVGKTYLAKIIHKFSARKDNNFIHLNCAEFQDTLLESELFGHTKGSFTGAVSDKKGMLEIAHNGTLFLDEVTSMPISIQRKLLKAIEEKSFYPVGSEKIVTSNFTLISASCDNIKELINSNKFREDLFFRLDGHRINIKPLKQRKEDINLLINNFINNSQRKVIILQDAIDTLLNYEWPGNVRELRKVISQITLEDKGLITNNELPNYITSKLIENKTSNSPVSQNNITFIKDNGLRKFFDNLELETVKYFYDKNKNNVSKTIDELKIAPKSFYNLLDQLSVNESYE